MCEKAVNIKNLKKGGGALWYLLSILSPQDCETTWRERFDKNFVFHFSRKPFCLVRRSILECKEKKNK